MLENLKMSKNRRGDEVAISRHDTVSCFRGMPDSVIPEPFDGGFRHLRRSDYWRPLRQFRGPMPIENELNTCPRTIRGRNIKA